MNFLIGYCGEDVKEVMIEKLSADPDIEKLWEKKKKTHPTINSQRNWNFKFWENGVTWEWMKCLPQNISADFTKKSLGK